MLNFTNSKKPKYSKAKNISLIKGKNFNLCHCAAMAVCNLREVDESTYTLLMHEHKILLLLSLNKLYVFGHEHKICHRF